MLPKYHFIIGVLAAIILFPIFGLNVWVLIVTIVLLDIDHYFTYIYRYKNFDLKKAYNFFKTIEDGSSFYLLFHSFETFAIILFFAIYSEILFLELIAIGMLVHIIHDLFEDLFLRTTNRNFFVTKFLYEKIFRYSKNRTIDLF